VKRDFYFNEAINIGLDYLQRGKKLAIGNSVPGSRRAVSTGQ